MGNMVSQPLLLLGEEIVAKEKKLDQSQGGKRKIVYSLRCFSPNSTVSVMRHHFLPQLILHKFQNILFVPLSSSLILQMSK